MCKLNYNFARPLRDTDNNPVIASVQRFIRPHHVIVSFLRLFFVFCYFKKSNTLVITVSVTFNKILYSC